MEEQVMKARYFIVTILLVLNMFLLIAEEGTISAGYLLLAKRIIVVCDLIMYGVFMVIDIKNI